MFVHFLHHHYTSGHDYLDVKRASCLMHTHWNTVYCGSSTSTSNSTFSRSEVRTPDLETCCNSVYCDSSSSTFCRSEVRTPDLETCCNSVYCDSSSSTFCRSEVRTPDLETCCNSVYCDSSSSTFSRSEVRTPDLETCWMWIGTGTARCGGKEGKRPMMPIASQCSNGYALGSFLFPRQDNHGHRCIIYVTVFSFLVCGRFSEWQADPIGRFIFFWVSPARRNA